MIYFSDFDTYILANSLNLAQLHHEVRHAQMMASVNDFWNGTPYADNFPWGEYADCCREAISWIEAHNQAHSQQSSPKNERVNITDIKSRVDIVNIIERYTQLRKSGHNRYIGRCPFHQDNHPSLTVYADQQSWHCFQCSKGGDIFSFILLIENTDFRGAATILGREI